MARIDVMKTYKLFIGGKFPRSESGRVYELKDAKGKFLANPCQASRKDLRDSVVAARSAFNGWSTATAYNRGQILYRIAEVMQGRSAQFADELIAQEGLTPKAAATQVEQAIDLWVWYAGWSDKLSALSGAENPVSGPFYNFTSPEALGVVGAFVDGKPSLLSLVGAIAPIITSGNTAVVVASEKFPLSAITLSEVLATSDLPAGVVNTLTGKSSELISWMGEHMEIDGIDATGLSTKALTELKIAGANNLKRIHSFSDEATPARIQAFMENKTIWQNVGI
jgi:acyl-CoA reductase-like NAD-dependent aldehyde dehydrogenase